LEQCSEKFIRKYQPTDNNDSNTVVAAAILSPGTNHEKKFLRATLKKTYILYLAFFGGAS